MNRPLPKKTWLILTLLLASTGLFTFFLLRDNTSDSWIIKVSGTETVDPGQITEIIGFLLESEQESITPELVENTLKMNPRINNVNVSIGPGKRIDISILESETAALLHGPGGSSLNEYSYDGKLLREEISQLNDEFSTSVPILYLTEDLRKTKGYNVALGDITRLWSKTQYNYMFLWDRISEIEIISLQPLQYCIYMSNQRVAVNSTLPWSSSLLNRLWALFYYLEQQKGSQWLTVELSATGAYIQVLK